MIQNGLVLKANLGRPIGVTRYSEEIGEALLKYVAMKADQHTHIAYASNAQVHRAERKQSATLSSSSRV